MWRDFVHTEFKKAIFDTVAKLFWKRDYYWESQVGWNWPLSLAVLSKWNESGEVRRFVKQFAGRADVAECEDLARLYLEQAQLSWFTQNGRTARFF
ncbi:hypothetical protein [Alicyclobacillus sp.]|uniref:hypothetical protein n=1 Tax=Alicyclobacillus sp. TaxID=61169 RepID=UPI0025BD7689|nr:hypothetical protein [Alicyclobacillus sp.]MCL6517889.1 hypothetical protein [Alicyclobacillus sp.]